MRNVCIGPNDLGTIVLVKMLDSLAGVSGDLACLYGVRHSARKDLHRVIRRARGVCPSITPATNDWSDLFWPIELRNAQLAEVIHYSIEPFAPLITRRGSQLLIISAALVVSHHEAEAALIRCAALLDRFIEGGNEFRRAGLAAQPLAAAPCVPIGVPLCLDLGDALQFNHDHCAPRTLPAHDQVH